MEQEQLDKMIKMLVQIDQHGADKVAFYGRDRDEIIPLTVGDVMFEDGEIKVWLNVM